MQNQPFNEMIQEYGYSNIDFIKEKYKTERKDHNKD